MIEGQWTGRGKTWGWGTSEEATEVIRETEDIGPDQGGDSSGGEERKKLGHSLEVDWKGQVEGQEVGCEKRGRSKPSPALCAPQAPVCHVYKMDS